MALKIAQGNQEAQRLAAALQSISRGQGGSQTDYAEDLRALSGVLEAFVDASTFIDDEDKKTEFVELLVNLMGGAALGVGASYETITPQE